MERAGKSIVIDNGSDIVKVGFAGSETQTLVFHRNDILSMSPSGFESTSPSFSFDDPDREAQRRVFQHALSAMTANPEEHPILVSLDPSEEHSESESPRPGQIIASVLFDVFGVPSISIVSDARLALYATGNSTAVVVDLGAGSTRITAFHEYDILDSARLPVDTADEELAKKIVEVVMECNRDAWKDLFAFIELVGGRAMERGLADRLHIAVNKEVQDDTRRLLPRIRSQPQRQYATWIGGSVVAFEESVVEEELKPIWISKSDYEAMSRMFAAGGSSESS